MEGQLKQLAIDYDVADRVNFVGYKTHQELVKLYNQADALVLASSREGLPNVLLEAMACGTPVISSPVGGAVEVVTEASAGILLEERSANSIERAVKRLMQCLPMASDTREYAEQFSWEATMSNLRDRLERSTQK